ncbi:MAG: TRAP transporter large permease subunit, partial [Hyphomicrobiaceae bacterium]
MSGGAMALTGFAVMLLLIAARMPVGLAMLVVGSIGLVSLNGWGSFVSSMKTDAYEQFATPTFAVIPLFILMGAFAERSGMARDLFAAARVLVGHFRGGLAMAVLFACTVFGAICGSSVATTATFGRAALPELRRYRYDDGFATATIAVGGVVDLLIPPSIILVVYAIAAEANIVKLFQAALVPGLMAVVFYCTMIAIIARRRPEHAPTLPRSDRAQVLPSLLLAAPAVAVLLLVLGGIYGGIFAPHDAAAVGCVAMLAAGLLQRRLGWRELRESLLQTA